MPEKLPTHIEAPQMHTADADGFVTCFDDQLYHVSSLCPYLPEATDGELVLHDHHKREHHDLSSLQHSLAGVCSGVVMRAVTQPLDVLKIRFQLQVDPIKRSGRRHHKPRKIGKYTGVAQATRLIIHEEGVSALWKGHLPGQYLSAVYGVMQFVSFERLTRWSYTHLPASFVSSSTAPITNFVCGAVAGSIAMTTALPLDVLRTRFVAQGQGKNRVYRSMLHAMQNIYTTEGFFAFYRGFIPTIVQIAPFTGLQFAFYRLSIRLWRWGFVDSDGLPDSNTGSIGNVGALESLVCGGTAGCAAKSALYPLDMVKKRLQMIGFERARTAYCSVVPKYKGLTDCTQSIIKHEGLAGLYKGMVPSIYKAASASGIGFLVYEQVCRMLREQNHDQP